MLAAKEAQERIENAKQKMFGVSAAKQAFESSSANKIREELRVARE